MWHNDLDSDTDRHLTINAKSSFFNGLKDLALDEAIAGYLSRYTDFDFYIDYDKWVVTFRKGEDERIKISRGEEKIFIWCMFMAICERVIGKIFGQEKNITTYNLARMNMLLHGVKDTEFEIYHGDTLTNEWDMLREINPAKKPYFDAVVANPPFSYRWDPNEALGEDVRFKNYGLAPKSAADFAFLLHGFHYLKDDGVMAIILPHGVLFRGGAEAKIRRKLIEDGHIDTVIGLPANLFYSTGIPVCILVLKQCKKPDDVLFINACEHFERGKRQNYLSDGHIAKIIDTYQQRAEGIEQYATRGKLRTKPVPPIPNRFMADIDAALVKQILDIAQRQREPHIHHHRQADDFLAGLEILEWITFRHPDEIGRRQRRLNPSSFDKAIRLAAGLSRWSPTTSFHRARRRHDRRQTMRVHIQQDVRQCRH